MISGYVQTLIAVVIILCSLCLWFKRRQQPTLRSVAVVVLGDVGRSPRMMYQAESFAINGFETYIIGYQGSKPIPSLLSLPHVLFLHLSEFRQSLPFAVSSPFKILHQICTLLVALVVRMPRTPEFILVQNPPSIPTLAIVWAVGQLFGSKVIIDWHNLGYSILALRLGKQHPFVRIAERFEAYFGQTAFAHLFVTNAMRDRLVQKWNLQGRLIVLHDRPPRHFHHATPPESHEVLIILSMVPTTVVSFLPVVEPPHSTPFTKVTFPPSSADALFGPYHSEYDIKMREDRPALAVSSTSWSPDEDFGMLLQALEMYEGRAAGAAGRLPKLFMIVTGKGPLKEQYMARVDKMQKDWRWVRCISLWLQAEDYPLLLGAADLGICLHSSSSGLDLPMKVVDMFGCGLPVCALDFECLDELVKDGINGLVFGCATQLACHLEKLLMSFPNSNALAALRSSLSTVSKTARPSPYTSSAMDAVSFEWSTWEENWNRVIRPLILSDEGRNHSASITS